MHIKELAKVVKDLKETKTCRNSTDNSGSNWQLQGNILA